MCSTLGTQYSTKVEITSLEAEKDSAVKKKVLLNSRVRGRRESGRSMRK